MTPSGGGNRAAPGRSRPASAAHGLERRFQDLLDAAPDAMVIVDREGRIVLANTQTEALFGWSRQELLGEPVEKLVPERFRDAHPDHREGYGGDPRTRPMGAGLDLAGLRRDGSEFPAEISLSPLPSGDDDLLVTAAIRDVSERKRHEVERLREEEELARSAREASRLKSEFLANMSHELRTPLNAILGFAEMLHDGRLGPMSPDHREYVGDILHSARHLLQLINDVLDLAKVEAGRLEFRPQRVDVATLVDDSCDTLRDLAARQQITLTRDLERAGGLGPVWLDPGRLRQILLNFLSNALKFTPVMGHVVVRVLPEGEQSLRIEVEDDGIGIPEDRVPRLFVEFQQLDAGLSKRFQGTGLGLALTRQLAEAQGGGVGFRPAASHGSVFWVVLPRDSRAIGTGAT